ncbi:gamma-glutamyl-gamma-aminobutyrate hydrolase family protein [Kutzneria sp. NPDC051319]|uniref:CTP synthase C-terminal region-related (seleno)protein n=1 Tax=Kutzneria sp. NPDC051319 TaxID=3155047 RepID=UPI00342904B8
MTGQPRVALVGDRSADVHSHERLDTLIPHLRAQIDWVGSDTVTDSIGDYDGIWVIPGSPYKDKDSVLFAIETARQRGIPYLGTCGGFQHALIEYGRNVLGFADADDVQYDPDAPTAFITPLACSLVGETAPLHLTSGSRLAEVYGGAESTVETYHCKYGLNPEYIDAIVHSPMQITGWDAEKAPRAVELPEHPFFIGTLFQPELSSTPSAVHPLIERYVDAVIEHARTTR